MKPAAEEVSPAAACVFCPDVIARGERRIHLSQGQAHVRCNLERVRQTIDEARAAGTHGDACRTVCPRCRQWCNGLWQGPRDGGKGYCINCAAELGDKLARRTLGWPEEGAAP